MVDASQDFIKEKFVLINALIEKDKSDLICFPNMSQLRLYRLSTLPKPYLLLLIKYITVNKI